MCTLSMVYDHYKPLFPEVKTYTTPNVTYWPAPIDLEELRELIAEFREVVKAAKLIDEKTGQPDCFDPEKATLEERVARLEGILNG